MVRHGSPVRADRRSPDFRETCGHAPRIILKKIELDEKTMDRY
jgi:hypothetical protein